VDAAPVEASFASKDSNCTGCRGVLVCRVTRVGGMNRNEYLNNVNIFRCGVSPDSFAWLER